MTCKIRVTILASVMLLFLVSSLLGCGGGSVNQPLNSQQVVPVSPLQPQVDHVYREVALDQALDELAALETPPGTDAVQFAELKAELERVLRELYSGDETDQLMSKRATALDPALASAGWALQGKTVHTGEVTVHWRGRHAGDYDLNGEVNISDITPLGMLFKSSVAYDAEGFPEENGDNEWAAVVDGDENTELNIADITPIGVYFKSTHLGYRVYYGTSTDGEAFHWEASFIPNPTDAGAPVSMPLSDSKSAGNVHQYSLSFTPPDLLVGELGYAKVVPFDGSAEGQEIIIPLPPGPHALFNCEVCHFVIDMSFRGIDSSCHNCHITPPESSSSSWDDVPGYGMHGACLSCHDEHLFSITPAESACGMCHSSIVTDATAASMPACLTCHEGPHVPNAAPETTSCAPCHPTEVAGIADELMPDCATCHSAHKFSQTYEAATCTGCHANPDNNAALQWSSAPGLHGSCANCHELHNFSMDAPNTVCADCHQAQIDANHANGSTECLSCHSSPHVPTQVFTAEQCVECHTTPPENSATTWAEVPGLHAQCLTCHPGDHPDRPVPAEKDCLTCHTADWGEEHESEMTICLECHTFPHLPTLEYNIPAEDCITCHQGYTGDGNHVGGCDDCHRAKVHPPQDGWQYCEECHFN